VADGVPRENEIPGAKMTSRLAHKARGERKAIKKPSRRKEMM
jgi:hypothetical protein